MGDLADSWRNIPSWKLRESSQTEGAASFSRKFCWSDQIRTIIPISHDSYLSLRLELQLTGHHASLTSTPEKRLDSDEVAALYQQYETELRRFLWGVLKDPNLVEDTLQSSFKTLVEQGHNSQIETRKAWLFRVAYHEALSLKRQQKVQKQAFEQLQANVPSVESADWLEQKETALAVRMAIESLSPELQQVLHLRIYEERTFAEIAQQLKIPLGTALGRMRNALTKLKQKLHPFDQ